MKIAVIGSGIAGLGAAWALSRTHDVTVFEAGTSLGGHANTATVSDGGRTIPVDTGFIVYNDRRDFTDYTSLETLGRSFVVKYTRLIDF